MDIIIMVGYLIRHRFGWNYGGVIMVGNIIRDGLGGKSIMDIPKRCNIIIA